MRAELASRYAAELGEIRAAGLEKRERLLDSPQGGRVRLLDGAEVMNLCANDYLGLAGDRRVLDAAREALDRWGFGLASVRFICGTQTLHAELEDRISGFLGSDATILHGSCFDANTGLFETLLDERDAIVSDALNHASIIDGIRLCKARRLRYANGDLDALEAGLRAARDGGAQCVMIATDGVFSMDGHVAPLAGICDLADRFGALVMVDDSHAVGCFGPGGRGTPALHGVADRVDLVTGTLGKALGGASGGYVSGRRELIALLRQRSRPYLFSNTVAPPIVAASLRVFELLEQEGEALRTRLHANAAAFRAALERSGLTLLPGSHPIVPVMYGEAQAAVDAAEQLLAEGIYVTPFSFPVVPRGQARIRTQLSAAHTPAEVARAAEAFAHVRARTSPDAAD